MRRNIVAAAMLCVCLCAMDMGVEPVIAAEEETITTIYDGVSVGPVEIGGMTKQEAQKAVNDYIKGISDTKLTLSLEGVTNPEKKITVTAADLGLKWANPEVIDEAMGLGDIGNVVRRYKAKKDIENNSVVFDLEFTVDKNTLKSILDTNAGILSEEPKDATITKEGSRFTYTDEVDGKTVDTENAITSLAKYLTEEWNYHETEITLATIVSEAKITRELCESIEKEPMGSFTTSFTSSSSSRCGNIENAVKLMTGSVILPGETFSCLEHMVPFTKENGYYLAGSYLNGRTVDSYGGGVCQVSTTLYNAVLLAELEVVQRNNHGLTVSYVPLSSDAAIAESSGMDFIFKNNTNAPIYLEGYVENKTLTFNLYGHDERPANRTIKYESRVVEVISPGADVVTVDESMPIGSQVVTQSSHTGYRAELYKYVYVNGEQESVERVNSSYYAPSPNYVVKGPDKPNTLEQETNPDGTLVVELDENGNPIQPVLDENGNPVQPAVDGNGNPVNPAVDENGNPVSPAVDENGNPVNPAVDENGNPIQPGAPVGNGETGAPVETVATAETPGMPAPEGETISETPAETIPTESETPGVQEALGTPETSVVAETPAPETQPVAETTAAQETPEAPLEQIVPVG